MGQFYGRRKTYTTQILYLISAVVWLIIIVFFELHNQIHDIQWKDESGKKQDFSITAIGYFILAIPLVVFFISFINANYLTVEIEKNSYLINYISIGLIVIIPILTLVNNFSTNTREDQQKKAQIMKIILLALILIVLSTFDVWVRPKWVSLVKHLRSIFQTLALTLILFALYLFFREFSRYDSNITAQSGDQSNNSKKVTVASPKLPIFD